MPIVQFCHAHNSNYALFRSRNIIVKMTILIGRDLLFCYSMLHSKRDIFIVNIVKIKLAISCILATADKANYYGGWSGIMDPKLHEHIQFYYNCRSSQYLTILLERKQLTPTLFYNAYENTQMIYELLFVTKSDRWSYRNPKIYHALTSHHMAVKRIVFHDPQALEAFLEQRFNQQEESVLVYANNEYLPHRQFGKDYTEHHSIHSVMIKNYRRTDGKLEFLIYDNSPPHFDYMTADTVMEYIFRDRPDWANYIEYLDYADGDREGWLTRLNQEEIMQEYYRFIRNQQDEFAFYDHVQSMVSGETVYSHFDNRKELFNYLSQAFSMIAGSRYLFLLFLDFIDYPPLIRAHLRRIFDMAMTLKNRFTKAIFSGKCDQEFVRENCNELKKIETQTLQALKALVV
jgi:hypothetical protein